MLKLITNIKQQIENPNINKRDLFKFFAVWAVLLAITIAIKLIENYALSGSEFASFFDIDVPSYFPFSVFTPGFRPCMLIGLPLLATIIYWLFRVNMTIKNALFFAVSILIISNISNGGLSRGYLETLTYGDVTYLQEALKIDNWLIWLRDFNQNHSEMFSHSASHPPGPTLLMHLMSPQFATFTYLILSLTNLTIFYTCLTLLKIEPEKKAWMVLFYSVIPSFNIYGILCADSMFLHFFNLFLLGICLYHNKKYRWLSYIYLPGSLIIVGFLTFAVTFLFALGGLYSLFLLRNGDYKFIKIYALSIIIFAFFYIGFNYFLGFNWLEGFFSASRSENPDGFALFHHPLNYFMTRLEGAWEFAVFAGIPFSIYLIKKPLKQILDQNPLALFAIIVVLLMLIAGAFRTGETGRVLMFVYPYFILTLKNDKLNRIKWLFLFVLTQSIIMQIFGFWAW